MTNNQPERNPVGEDIIPAKTTDIGVELKLASNASMYINTGNSQDQGARSYQEDSFGYSNLIDSRIVSSKGVFAVLADGMGGLSNGKAVSDFVVQSAIAQFEAIDPHASISEQLIRIAYSINGQISKKYVVDGSSKAGSTFVCAYIFKNRIYWLTIGDSRLYCYRRGHLLQMNEDHDYKNQLLRDYIDSGENADISALKGIEANAQKDSLVSFIGKNGVPGVDVSLIGYRILPQDTFVLCSDGIYNGITQNNMKEILRASDAQTSSDQIVASVLKARLPGQDNMTVMVIKCDKH